MTVTESRQAVQPSEPPAASTDKTSDQTRHEEYQYLDLVREILDEGELRRDRYTIHCAHFNKAMNNPTDPFL